MYIKQFQIFTLLSLWFLTPTAPAPSVLFGGAGTPTWRHSSEIPEDSSRPPSATPSAPQVGPADEEESSDTMLSRFFARLRNI